MKTVLEIARMAGVRDDGHRFEFDMFSLERFALLVIASQRSQSSMTWHEGYVAGKQGEHARLKAVMQQMFDAYGLTNSPPEEEPSDVKN